MTSDIPEKIKTFFSKYPARTYAKRELIVRGGEELPGVFFLAEGRINQYDITPAGNEVVINVFKPDAFFPMSNAINNTPNPYFFEASTDVTVRLAPAADAVQFLRDNPDVLFSLLSRVYRGVDGVLRRMAHLMGGDAKSRLLFELLNATYRFGETESDGTIRLPLTESDLARNSGLARETVNRNLQQFKLMRLIRIEQGSIIIPSTTQLEDALGDKI